MPSPTHWNSYHDAVTGFVENPSATLNDLCISIGLRTFTEKELAFTTIVKAEVPNLFLMTMGLASVIESSIKRKFSHIFDAKDAIIAALTMPKFKVK